MFQRSISTAFLVGALATVSSGIGLARDHGGHSSSGRGYSGRSTAPSGGRSYSGGSHYSAPRGYSGGGNYSGGRNFVAPRGYYGRGYVAPRVYVRPSYRGFYGGSVYLYGAPYAYGYDPYYYDPGYAVPPYTYGPAPAAAPPACTAGSYDQNGNWVPDPSCYADQQQYQQQPQQNYPQHDPQPQQN